jgi:hypothetical protein
MTKSDPSDVEILAQFESVISQDLRAYERPDACVYQITDAEVLQYYRLAAPQAPAKVKSLCVGCEGNPSIENSPCGICKAAAPELPIDKAARTGEPEVFSYDPTESRRTVRVIWPDGQGVDYVREGTQAPAAPELSDADIRFIALTNGFIPKWNRPGFGPDVHDYVFAFARAILKAQEAK